MVLKSFFLVPLLFLSCADVERDNPQDPNNVDGKVYSTALIGGKLWMAENLNRNVSGSKCYMDEPSNCDIYGRLYDLDMAKDVCPGGWHLPSSDEYKTLTGSFLANQSGGGSYSISEGRFIQGFTMYWGTDYSSFGGSRSREYYGDYSCYGNGIGWCGITDTFYFYVRCVKDSKEETKENL